MLIYGAHSSYAVFQSIPPPSLSREMAGSFLSSSLLLSSFQRDFSFPVRKECKKRDGRGRRGRREQA